MALRDAGPRSLGHGHERPAHVPIWIVGTARGRPTPIGRRTIFHPVLTADVRLLPEILLESGDTFFPCSRTESPCAERGGWSTMTHTRWVWICGSAGLLLACGAEFT